MISPCLSLPPAPDWEVLGPWLVGCCAWAGWGDATKNSWVAVMSAQVLCGCLGRTDTAANCFEAVCRLVLNKHWKKQWLACLHVTYQGIVFFFSFEVHISKHLFLLHWQCHPCEECYCMTECQGTVNIVKHSTDMACIQTKPCLSVTCLFVEDVPLLIDQQLR